MSLLTNFQDFATALKSALDKKADKTELPTAGQITQGNTGYATGGDVYTALGDVESVLSSINTALAGLIGGNS